MEWDGGELLGEMDGLHIPDNREKVYLISLGKLILVLDMFHLLCWRVWDSSKSLHSA